MVDYKEKANRIEIDHGFSHLKRLLGLESLRMKRQDITKVVVLLSIIAKNPSTFEGNFFN